MHGLVICVCNCVSIESSICNGQSLFVLVIFRRLERALNPLGLVSPSASIPKSRGSRGSAQSEYLKAFRRKSDGDSLGVSGSPSRWGRVSRVMTAS